MKVFTETRHRIILSIVIVVSFLLSIHAIKLAMFNGVSLQSEWKELLLLLFGALIGNFGKVVDYWFSGRIKTTHEEESP